MTILLLFIPFLSALALLLFRGLPARAVALVATLANLAVTGLLLSGFNGDGSFNHEVNVPWVANAGISFRLGLDGIGMLLVLLTNLLAPLIVLSSFSRNFGLEGRYYGLVLLMLGALNGVFMRGDAAATG